jgi:hypothetical protein
MIRSVLDEVVNEDHGHGEGVAVEGASLRLFRGYGAVRVGVGGAEALELTEGDAVGNLPQVGGAVVADVGVGAHVGVFPYGLAHVVEGHAVVGEVGGQQGKDLGADLSTRGVQRQVGGVFGSGYEPQSTVFYMKVFYIDYDYRFPVRAFRNPAFCQLP